MLRYVSWNLLAKLGAGAFETISGEVVNVILLTLNKKIPNDQSLLTGLEVSSNSSTDSKAKSLKNYPLIVKQQQFFRDFLDARIFLSDVEEGDLLSKYAYSRTGTRTADNPLFLISFWENQNLSDIWRYEQTSVNSITNFGGRHYLLRWENGRGLLEQYRKDGLYSIQGQDAWTKKGICLRLVGDLPATIYTGQIFDMNTGVIWPKKNEYLLPILAYCTSKEYSFEVRKIDQQLKLTTATLLKVYFDLDQWTKVAAEKYPNGLPKPYSDDPTQWIFHHGHPAQSDDPLQFAVARLLGYRWPAELDSTMELSDEARAWVKKSEALLPFADEDGIVCIPPVRGESSATDRLLNLLAAVYGTTWSNDKLSENCSTMRTTRARHLKHGFATNTFFSIASSSTIVPLSGISGMDCATDLLLW